MSCPLLPHGWSKRWHCLLWLCLLLLPAGTALAQNIRIAVGEFPPYLSAGLPGQGSAAQIIRDAFASRNIRVEFVFLPWARAYEDTLEGRFDATGIWLKRPDREKVFWFSSPLIKETHVFFHLKSRLIDWKTPDDLQGLQLGGIWKFSYGPAIDDALASGRLKMDRANNDIQNFKKLLSGRIDLYPEEINVGQATLRTHFSRSDSAQVVHHPTPFLETHNYLLFPKHRPHSQALLNHFNAGLKQIRQNGKYRAAFEGLHPSP